MAAIDSKRFVAATLRERLDVAEDLAVFRFDVDEPLAFVPGQYATLALPDGGGGIVQRPYSLASAPHEPAVELFVELVPQGALTPRLWTMRPGEPAWFRRRVVGRFTLDESTEGVEAHWFVATVTGIAPFVSMIRHRHERQRLSAAEGPAPRVCVMHAGSRSWELGPYRDELRGLAAANEWLTYVPSASRPWEDPHWPGETGRVDDLVRLYASRWRLSPTSTMVYTCGHPGMIESVRGILHRAGFPLSRVREEKYF